MGEGATAGAGRLAQTLVLLAVTALVLAPALALLYRFGVLELALALGGVGVAAGLAVLVALLAMVAAFLGWRRNSTADISLAGLAFFIAMVPVAMVGGQMFAAQQVPPIKDITTDPDNPPLLVGVAPGIPEASLQYAGAETHALQQAAWPELGSLVLDTGPRRTFELVQAHADRAGWEVVLEDAEEGHLEAVDTTFWFGFKDDIVVRVQPYPAGSLVDVRSVSRVGKSDLGVNARRIQALFKSLEESAPAVN